jgi:hypothetical protein
MLKITRKSTSDTIEVESFCWTHTVSRLDTLTVFLQGGGVLPLDDLDIYWNDNEKVAWFPVARFPNRTDLDKTVLPAILMGNRMLREEFVNRAKKYSYEGLLLSDEFRNSFFDEEEQVQCFQVQAKNDWKRFIEKTILKGNFEFETKELEQTIEKFLPFPVVFIMPATTNKLWLFNAIVSMIQCHCPQLLGWELKQNPNNSKDFVQLISKNDNEMRTIPENWSLDRVIASDSGERFYIFIRTISPEQDGDGKDVYNNDVLTSIRNVMSRKSDESGNIPKIDTYKYGNQKLRFHSIRAEVNENKTILLAWELRTRNIPLQPHPLPIITASGKLTGNCWEKIDGKDYWTVCLDNNLSELNAGNRVLAIPQLPVSRGHGVYVKPKSGDKVLVTIPHGSVPTATFLVQKNNDAEKSDVTIFGATTIKGKTTIQGESILKGNVKIES